MGARVKARQWPGAAVWRWGFVVAALSCAIVLALNAGLSELRSGNAWGISYGIAATVVLVGAMLIGARRRTMKISLRLRLGRSRTWLYFHVYGGVLFLLLVLMHSGFRLPVGALTTWLWILSLWTAASGLVGLGLQRWIPKTLSSGLAVEVNYERIPELIRELRESAQKLVQTCDPAVQSLYARNIDDELARPERRLIYFRDITGGIRMKLKELHYLRGLLGGEDRERLDELERIYRTKLEVDAHYTLQQALRGWLYIHVPVSIVLLILVVIHLFSVLYY